MYERMALIAKITGAIDLMTVIPGLDPGICTCLGGTDCRVKPDNDNNYMGE